MFQSAKHASVSLVPSGGGVFEITIQGTLVFSKKNLGRFPTDKELTTIISENL